MKSFKEFATFVRKHYLEEFISEEINNFQRLEVPLIKLFSHLSVEEFYANTRISLNRFLESIENDTALEIAQQTLEKWENDQLDGIPKDAIQPADLVLVYHSQKVALQKFLPYYTSDPFEIISIVREIEEYYSKVQNGAVQMLFKMQKKAEEELKYQKELYEDLLRIQSELGEGFVITEGNQYIYMNEAFCNITGYSEAEIRGFPSFMVLILPEDIEEIKRRFEQRNQGLLGLQYSEIRIRHKTGRIVHLAYSTQTVTFPDGRKQQFSIIRDISPQKEAQAALEESEARFRLLAEYSTDVISRTNTEGYFLYISPSCKTVFGYDPEELIGKNSFDLVHPDDLSSIEKPYENPDSDLRIRSCRCRKKDGSYIWLEFITRNIRNEKGEITEIHSSGRDITKRKLAEEALSVKQEELESSNADLRRFASIASHDLKEPLRKIHFFGGMLAERYADNLPEQGHTYLNRILASSNRMQRLIDDLLFFSQIGSGNSEDSASLTDLNMVFKDILEDLELFISEREADIEIAEMPVIVGVSSQLRQLFQNLISNALKFSHPDINPVIRIFPEIKDEYVQIGIKDNGIGFEEKYTPKIFEAFQRLHPKDKYEGSGIGLSVCKKIVQFHRGDITATSTPGEGSTFIVTLPLQQTTQTSKQF